MVLLFIGPSGSGKDTQAERLVQEFDFKRVSTGDLVREIADGDSEIQKTLKAAMNEGFLSDNFIFGLLQIYLTHVNYTDFILSGAVRWRPQIELLDSTLTQINQKLDKVVYFELSDEAAVERLSNRVVCPVCDTNYNLLFEQPKNPGVCDKNDGGILVRREDDNPEAIVKRLEDFHEDNKDILDEYERRGLLVKVDASLDIDKLYADLKAKLNL